MKETREHKRSNKHDNQCDNNTENRKNDACQYASKNRTCINTESKYNTSSNKQEKKQADDFCITIYLYKIRHQENHEKNPGVCAYKGQAYGGKAPF